MSSIDDFIAYQRDYNGVSAKRLTEQRTTLRALEVHSGADAHAVTDQQFAAFLQNLSAQGKHPNTVRYRGNLLRPFFTWAWSQQLIDGDRLMRLRAVKNPRGATGVSTPRPYTRKEIERMWQQIDAQFPRAPLYVKRWKAGRSKWHRVATHAMGLQVEAIVMLALHGGLRQDEIFRLSLEAMHPDNAYIVVEGAAKGGASREREVPMTEDLRRALAEWLAFRALIAPAHASPWLVLTATASPRSTVPSHPFNPMSRTKMMRLMGTVGSGWELHRLRHTCGTAWLRAGMPLEKVQRVLGHATLQQTLAYAQIVADDVHKAAVRNEPRFTYLTSRPREDAA